MLLLHNAILQEPFRQDAQSLLWVLSRDCSVIRLLPGMHMGCCPPRSDPSSQPASLQVPSSPGQNYTTAISDRCHTRLQKSMATMNVCAKLSALLGNAIMLEKVHVKS
jgi:hypothetical protein